MIVKVIESFYNRCNQQFKKARIYREMYGQIVPIIGASEVSSCHYKSYLEMVDYVLNRDKVEELNRLLIKERGHVAEELIINALEAHYRDVQTQIKLFSLSHNFLACTLDVLVDEEIIVEIKTSKNLNLSANIDNWKMQVTLQMSILAEHLNKNPNEIKAIIFAMDLNRGEYREIEVIYSEELFALALERASELHDIKKSWLDRYFLQESYDAPSIKREYSALCSECNYVKKCFKDREVLPLGVEFENILYTEIFRKEIEKNLSIKVRESYKKISNAVIPNELQVTFEEYLYNFIEEISEDGFLNEYDLKKFKSSLIKDLKPKLKASYKKITKETCSNAIEKSFQKHLSNFLNTISELQISKSEIDALIELLKDELQIKDSIESEDISFAKEVIKTIMIKAGVKEFLLPDSDKRVSLSGGNKKLEIDFEKLKSENSDRFIELLQKYGEIKISKLTQFEREELEFKYGVEQLSNYILKIK